MNSKTIEPTSVPPELPTQSLKPYLPLRNPRQRGLSKFAKDRNENAFLIELARLLCQDKEELQIDHPEILTNIRELLNKVEKLEGQAIEDKNSIDLYQQKLSQLSKQKSNKNGNTNLFKTLVSINAIMILATITLINKDKPNSIFPILLSSTLIVGISVLMTEQANKYGVRFFTNSRERSETATAHRPYATVAPSDTIGF